MAARKRNGSASRDCQRSAGATSDIGVAIRSAMDRGFVIGREVLVGNVPGIVVGYNIASYGGFVGNAYPLVVRTALGVTKCGVEELSLV